MAKFVQPVKDPWFESLQDCAICVFDLPVCTGVHYGRPIHADMVIVAESKELFDDELCAIVGDDGVWDPKRWIILVKKSTACSDLIHAIGRASIHFENLSMATSKWVKPPGTF
jgi:hypothetical protein